VRSWNPTAAEELEGGVRHVLVCVLCRSEKYHNIEKRYREVRIKVDTVQMAIQVRRGQQMVLPVDGSMSS
jgi:hypothetical protein